MNSIDNKPTGIGVYKVVYKDDQRVRKDYGVLEDGTRFSYWDGKNFCTTADSYEDAKMGIGCASGDVMQGVVVGWLPLEGDQSQPPFMSGIIRILAEARFKEGLTIHSETHEETAQRLYRYFMDAFTTEYNETGELIAVMLTDDECKILETLWERDPKDEDSPNEGL